MLDMMPRYTGLAANLWPNAEKVKGAFANFGDETTSVNRAFVAVAQRG
jgi:hypothetical protein